MSAASSDLIWILDADPACITLYQQTIGLQREVRAFANLDELLHELKAIDDGGRVDEKPRLLIIDPEHTKGSLTAYFKSLRENDQQSVALPEIFICSRVDDLEIIRFYLRIGVRDYIVKPLRPSELIAKVERALNNISNREVLILRNDLDGQQVTDLTFREHQLLTIFLSRTDRAIHRDDLYGAIWSKVTVNRKTLDVHLFNLRRKLRPLGYDIVCSESVFTLCKTERMVKTEKPSKKSAT